MNKSTQFLDLVQELGDRYAQSAQPPLATYRIQFRAGFTFQTAKALVPYLAKLGVDTLYASPIFKATPGSTHGYDVIDFSEFDPELGTQKDFDELCSELHRHNMHLLLDFVPNHMGIAAGCNSWWQDVLENGQTSHFGNYFDIDWRPIKQELCDQILLPVLGAPYGVVLEQGDLVLQFDADNGTFTVNYYQTPLPIAPPTYSLILKSALEQLSTSAAEDDWSQLELESLVTAFQRLPANNERDPELVTERRREQIVAKRRLATLAKAQPMIAQVIADTVHAINGTVGDSASFDQLDHLLDAQSYRLAFWRVAAEEINYRRFFAINELAAIRQELPEVFHATHHFLLELIGQRNVDGVRIDHIDGLWDPAGYLHQLQCEAFLARCRYDPASPAKNLSETDWATLREELGQWWNTTGSRRFEPGRPGPLYIVVEKILEAGEQLPTEWPCHGTVGYEFARFATGLFVDTSKRKTFDTLYRRFSHNTTTFDDLVYMNKKLIMRVALASEVNVLALMLNRISEQHRRTRDFTINALGDALREIIACFPIYRTYTKCQEEHLRASDQTAIEHAVRWAKRRNPASDLAVFDFIRDVLLRQFIPDLSNQQRIARCQFAMKFQQLTGAVMAKGVEDTTFYIDNRLTSLNEVGGNPVDFGIDPAAFHRENEHRLLNWPTTMLASSTHDTKRGEDTRARIDVLSEMPNTWKTALHRWERLNRRFKTKIETESIPSRNDEYLFYQTLLGVWPSNIPQPNHQLIDRVVAYMLKAIHEAQVRTSWINPNSIYDNATEQFVRSVLDFSTNQPFLDDFSALQTKVAFVGAVNGLSQQLLKLTAPGIPDIYQGSELWTCNLVDPDNRQPVDFTSRTQLLNQITTDFRSPSLTDYLDGYHDGRIKLFVTQRALAMRATQPLLFQTGKYQRLTADGSLAKYVFAFARTDNTDEIIVVVPRLVLGLCHSEAHLPLGTTVWGETRLMLPHRRDTPYRDVLTGAEPITVTDKNGMYGLDLATLFSRLPIALLQRL